MTQPVDNPRPADWGPCPTGEVHRLVHRMRARRRLHVVAAALFCSAALGVLVTVAASIAPPHRQSSTSPAQLVAGLTCGDVKAKLDGYRAGTLETKLMHKIERHLAQCPHCRDCLQDINRSEPKPPDGGSSEHCR